jgi:AraC family transcriptional regulator
MTEPRGKLPNAVLERVRELVQVQLGEDLSLTDIAAQVGVSPFHLTRLFKRSSGMSLHQYIIAQRVAAAQHLLLHSTMPLKQVAAQVGFADQSHLTRHFRRMLGVTPAQVRLSGQTK